MKVVEFVKKNWILFAFGAVVIFIAWVYFRGKEDGTTENVEATLTHPDGTTEKYNPSELVMKLKKTLSSWCIVCSERCEIMKEVYDLPVLKFMAFTKAYKQITGVELAEAVKSVHFECRGFYNDTLSNLIVTRIENLEK